MIRYNAIIYLINYRRFAEGWWWALIYGG